MNTVIPTSGTSRASTLLSAAAIGTLALTACGPDTTGDEAEPGSAVTVGTDNDSATQEQDAAAQDDQARQDEGAQQNEDAQQDAAEGEDGETPDEPLFQAIDAALAEHPDGVVTELDTDDDYYEIVVYEGQTEWELEVDRESFEIIDAEEDGIDSDDQQRAEAVEIDIVEALTTAAEEGGAEVEQVELDTEGGAVIWEIELTNDVEVSVDVSTGEVRSTDS